uniref:Uncharacterized protein n=1 Tax=Oncorhynchus tshawytscha TaxID=74940 RepID=A0A8C8ILC0_ONCTS
MTSQMDQLEVKLQAELQSAAKVVACHFFFPTRAPDGTAGEGIGTVWVYDAVIQNRKRNTSGTYLCELDHFPLPLSIYLQFI